MNIAKVIKSAVGPLGAQAGLVSSYGAPSLIKSIQRGVISFVSLNAPTATIASVNTANAFVSRVGMSSPGGVTVNPQYAVAFSTLVLTNATTVTANLTVGSYGMANVESFEVIEFAPGVVKSMQTGTITQGGTVFITGVDTTKTMLMFLGAISSYAGSGGGLAEFDWCAGYLSLTSSTTISFTAGATPTLTAKYVAVEFF